MKADFQNFKKATSVCLLGLALQLLLGFTLLIYSVLSRDHAAFTASLFTLIGAAVWLVLAIVFDQHRRERVEAMEAESLAALSARQSTVFQENADDLLVAAKRLAWMHKVLVPTSSLIVAALLIAIGSALTAARDSFDTVFSLRPSGWPIAIGLGLAAVGFLFGRFVSGMAKQPIWANLAGRRAQTVGFAVFGLAMAVGQFVDIAGPDTVLRYLPLVFPLLLILIGTEIVLNFILTIYRPRKPGENPGRPSTPGSSGFIAAPDKSQSPSARPSTTSSASTSPPAGSISCSAAPHSPWSSSVPS